jgi:integrase/recombinase XerD
MQPTNELRAFHCTSPIEKALLEFMFSTGCRIGEIVSL